MAKVSLKQILFVIGWNILSVAFSSGDFSNLMNHHVNARSYARPLNFAGSDLIYLSELPLEQLLHVKKAINELKQMNFPNLQEESIRRHDLLENRMISDDQTFGSKLGKNALAFTDEKKIDRKHGWMEDPWDSKPSKVQSFFQISITALAFLAFAGYLLCMIVQAIKSKGTMYLYPNAMSLTSGTNTMNAMTNTGSVPLIRKRRPVGRRRRSIFISADNRNDTSLYSYELLASPDPAEMYNVMIQCAEDYTKLYFVQ